MAGGGAEASGDVLGDGVAPAAGGGLSRLLFLTSAGAIDCFSIFSWSARMAFADGSTLLQATTSNGRTMAEVSMILLLMMILLAESTNNETC